MKQQLPAYQVGQVLPDSVVALIFPRLPPYTSDGVDLQMTILASSALSLADPLCSCGALVVDVSYRARLLGNDAIMVGIVCLSCGLVFEYHERSRS